MSIPIATPLVLVGGVSTVTGLYLMFCQYMKDPYYTESSRKEDLVKGVHMHIEMNEQKLSSLHLSAVSYF